MDHDHHTTARKTIFWCVVVGTVTALLLSPIPCASWPVLMAIEVYMLISIVKLYDYELDGKLLLIIFGLLLGISAVLSFVVGDLISLLTAMLFAPVVKPIVAALVIWGLGEGAIYVLDRHAD